MKITIILICLFLPLVGCVFETGYPNYVIENGNSACEYCFDELMISYDGGTAWTEIICSGEHNKVILWSDDTPEEATCKSRGWDCREENEYLYHTTLQDYNCSQIKIMIDANSYKGVVETYYSIDCFSNNTYESRFSDTASCKECAKDTWVNHYLNKCT